jgi:hypothetical protein
VKIERPIVDATGAVLKVGDTVLIPMYGALCRATLLYFTESGRCIVTTGGKTRITRNASNVVLLGKES